MARDPDEATPHHGERPTPPGPAVPVLLRDGELALLRQLAGTDRDALLDLHRSLSPDSSYLRFRSAGQRVGDAFVARVTRPPDHDHAGVVLERRGRLLGVASYERLPPPPGGPPADGEIAFVVDDGHRGLGVATLLLEHLAALGRAAGIRRFLAVVMPANRRMLDVLAEAGFANHRTDDAGEVRVDLDLTTGLELLAALDHREHAAQVASLGRLFRPRSVAVVGASDREHSVGGAVLRNLLAGGFRGEVYPVNPRRRAVQGLPAHPRLRDVPGPVDLVVVAVPADDVIAVVDDCPAVDAGAVVVLSAGFADVGPAGAEREARLRQAALRAGVRLVGPNCLGVVNTEDGVRLDASFAPHLPNAGRIGLMAQSGGLGIALLEHTRQAGLGLSTFVSVGNKVDVSGNDLLTWWSADAGTDVVVLHLESFGNPRKFARLARAVSAVKPVVAVSAGRSEAGARAARSHTAAAATPARAVEALFRQAGVIGVHHLGELVDVVALLSTQPLPAGRRIAVVGNAGGPGILAADAAVELGLVVGGLADGTRRALAEALPSGAATGNPVDTIAAATGDQFGAAVSILLADPSVDAVLAIITPTPLTGGDDLPAGLAAAAAGSAKPVLASVVGAGAATTVLRRGGATVPVYAYPEAALRAFAHVAGYGEFRRRPSGRLPDLPGCRTAQARSLVAGVLAAHPDGAWLEPPDAQLLLDAYGVPTLPGRMVADADAAGEAAGVLGLPVVLKAVGPDLVHKSDVGGVALGLSDAAQVRDAYRRMAARVGDRMTAGFVQPMAAPGVEVVVGLHSDPTFGSLVMFGLGGVLTDLLDDRAFRLLPLTDLDAAELVRSVRGYPVLAGYRGRPVTDVAALEDLLLRVGRLSDDLPEVAELDLNPVVVGADGVLALDVKVRVAPARPTPDPYARRLR